MSCVGKIYRLPGEDDRFYIRRAIALQAAGRIGQRAMNDLIARVLRGYGIKQLVCGSFRVRDRGDYETSEGLFPIIIIDALEVSPDGCCPACGGREGSWLRGDRHITVFCRRCGCVYERRATDAETC